MHNAKDLICQGFKIKKVAELVGYADVYTFSKAFKKFYGISPGKANPGKYPDVEI